MINMFATIDLLTPIFSSSPGVLNDAMKVINAFPNMDKLANMTSQALGDVASTLNKTMESSDYSAKSVATAAISATTTTSIG